MATALCSMATRALLAELAAEHGRRTGTVVEVVAVGGVVAAKRVRAGEAFDAVVLAADAMAALEAEGLVRAGSLVAVARSGMAAAVRAGRPRPPLAGAADLASALRAAGRIGHSTGPSGDHLLRLVERLGLAEALGGRLVQAPPGVPVARLLAEGHADLGFQQLSELVGQPGIDLLGPLPPDVQSTTTFAGGVAAAAPDPGAAGRFVAFVASSAAAVRRHGMEPA